MWLYTKTIIISHNWSWKETTLLKCGILKRYVMSSELPKKKWLLSWYLDRHLYHQQQSSWNIITERIKKIVWARERYGVLGSHFFWIEIFHPGEKHVKTQDIFKWKRSLVKIQMVLGWSSLCAESFRAAPFKPVPQIALGMSCLWLSCLCISCASVRKSSSIWL